MSVVVHISKNKGWEVYERTYDGRAYMAVLPVGDILEHDTWSVNCGCIPKMDGIIIIHNAHDNRTAYEENNDPA